MLEYTGQNPGLVPKYRATHEFITKHNSHNPVDIQCSFLENSPLGYGCFLQKHGAMHWRCGVTDDDAVTWSVSITQSLRVAYRNTVPYTGVVL